MEVSMKEEEKEVEEGGERKESSWKENEIKVKKRREREEIRRWK